LKASIGTFFWTSFGRRGRRRRRTPPLEAFLSSPFLSPFHFLPPFFVAFLRGFSCFESGHARTRTSKQVLFKPLSNRSRMRRTSFSQVSVMQEGEKRGKKMQSVGEREVNWDWEGGKKRRLFSSTSTVAGEFLPPFFCFHGSCSIIPIFAPPRAPTRRLIDGNAAQEDLLLLLLVVVVVARAPLDVVLRAQSVTNPGFTTPERDERAKGSANKCACLRSTSTSTSTTALFSPTLKREIWR